jgi:GntR family transcriptional regulator/MocR family aminotransferase
MDLKTRQKLLKWASYSDAYIIEDDYCREFRYTSRPLPSLQSLDLNERVIYIGTFSKAFSPAIRLNYIVLPPALFFKWLDRFKGYHSETPWLTQAILEKFFAEGHWDAFLRRTQTRNKRKYEYLIAALKRFMGDKVDIREFGSGLHLLVGVKDGRDQHTLIDAAAKYGVRVYETDKYWIRKRHPMGNYVLIGFSSISRDMITPGIRRLSEAWFD